MRPTSIGLVMLFVLTAAAVGVVAVNMHRQQAQLDTLEKAIEALEGSRSDDVAADEGASVGSSTGELGVDSAAQRAVFEIAAVASLRNFVSAQAQFQQSGRADGDHDGTGEYGGLLEMSGASEGRMMTRLIPHIISGTFRSLNELGEASRSGYFFRIYLPNADGAGIGEPRFGFTPQDVDPERAERAWCCYAWPVEYGTTGTRTFFTNQEGDVLVTDSAAYSGKAGGPESDAAFVEQGRITGATASGVIGVDGNVWQQYSD